jgi:hypothetical protein
MPLWAILCQRRQRGENRRGRSTDDDRGYAVRPWRHPVRAAAPHPVCPRPRGRRWCPPYRASSSRPAKAFARSWVNHRDCPQERHLAPDLYTDASRTSTESGSRESEARRTADKSPLPTGSRCKAARRLHVDGERRVGRRLSLSSFASATADGREFANRICRACVIAAVFVRSGFDIASRPSRAPRHVALSASRWKPKVHRGAIRTKYEDPKDNGATNTLSKIHLHLRDELTLSPAFRGEKNSR